MLNIKNNISVDLILHTPCSFAGNMLIIKNRNLLKIKAIHSGNNFILKK